MKLIYLIFSVLSLFAFGQCEGKRIEYYLNERMIFFIVEKYSIGLYFIRVGSIEAKEAIQHMGTALDLYMQIIRQIGSIDDHDLGKPLGGSNSLENARLLGFITTSLLNANDAFIKSKEAVYQQCDFADSLLSVFIRSSNKMNLDAQKNLLDKVIEKGISKMNESLQELTAASSGYFSAASNLTSLCNQLASESNESIKSFYSDLNTKVSNAYRISSDSESETKKKLRNEIQMIENLKSQLSSSNGDGLSQQDVIESIENYKNKCHHFLQHFAQNSQ